MDRYDAYVSPRCRYPSRPPEHILNSLRPEHRTLVALPLALDPLVSALPNKQCTKYLVNLKQSKAPIGLRWARSHGLTCDLHGC